MIKKFYIIVILFFISIVSYNFYKKNSYENKDLTKIKKKYTSIKPKHNIKGFVFEKSVNGKKFISIKADEFKICKKKIGYLSFHMLNEAIFKNAFINIYGKKKINKNNKVYIEFENIILRENFSSIPVKRLTSIIIKPVNINLYDQKQLLTNVVADFAIIKLKKRSIYFKKNIKVISGNSILTTDNLYFIPKKGVFKTDKFYTLKCNKNEIKGQGIKTDFLLSPLTNGA